MPKLRREEVEDLDVDDLEQAEYSTEEYATYYGEVPPAGITLRGYVKRLWWTRTAIKQDGSGDDPLLKVLWVAADNEGDYEEYNDCPFWLNYALIKSVKFRWAPFFEEYGISIRDFKPPTKVYIVPDGNGKPKEDQNGFVIEKIGAFKPGEDEDGAWCRIITEQEPYNGQMQARVKSWLPWDEEDDEADEAADEAEDLDDEEADEDEYDEDEEGDEDEGEDEDEDEPDEEPPARTRRGSPRTAAKPAASRSKPASRTASKPAARTRGTKAKAPAGKARTGSTRASTARTTGTRGKAASTKPATTGRGRGRKAADNEPPF